MKIVKTESNGNRRYSIYEQYGQFEIVCLVYGQCSRSFPTREYKKLSTAIARGEKFLNS